MPDAVDDLADLYHELARRGELYGFAATERFYEIGTSAALAETDAFLASGGRVGASSGASSASAASATAAPVGEEA